MLKFDLYAIVTEKKAWRPTIDELFLSFGEAVLNAKKYINNNKFKIVWIHKYPANEKFDYKEAWRIDENGNIKYFEN